MTFFDRLVQKHRKNGLLIDTNLLLLFFIGSFNRQLISTFKRTHQFTEDDYVLLVDLMLRFGRLITTPNILTEVSNLSNQLPENVKRGYFKVFEQRLSALTEIYVETSETVKDPALWWLGVTDAGILHVAGEP